MKKYLLILTFVILTFVISAQEKITFNGYLKELTMYYKPVNPIAVSVTDSLNSLLLNQFHNRLNFKWNATEKLVFDLEIRNRLFFGQMVKKFPDYEQMIDEEGGYFDLGTVLIRPTVGFCIPPSTVHGLITHSANCRRAQAGSVLTGV